MKEKLIENEEKFEDLEIISFSDDQIDEKTKQFFSQEFKDGKADTTQIISYANLAIRAKDIAFGMSVATKNSQKENFDSRFLIFELKKLTQIINDINFDHKNEKEFEFFKLILEWMSYYIAILAENKNTKKIIEEWFQNQNSKN